MSSEQLNNSQGTDPTSNMPLTREQIAFAEALAHDLARLWKRQQRQLAPEEPLAPPSQDADAEGRDPDLPLPDGSIKAVNRA